MIYYRHYIMSFLALPGIDCITTEDPIIFGMFYMQYFQCKNKKVKKCTANELLRVALKSMHKDGVLIRQMVSLRHGPLHIYKEYYVYRLNEQYAKDKKTTYHLNPDGTVTTDGVLPEPEAPKRSEADNRSIAEKYWWLKDF